MSDSATIGAAELDALHADPDPFGFRTRWYEQRKRAIVLATLPHARYGRGWEIGCSNGELAAALAARCDTLLATDLSPRAVALARARNQALPHVRIEQAEHPRDWPDGQFDLIVLGEVGYYLAPDALAQTIRRGRASLAPGGVFVACHWLRPFAGASCGGDEVQARVASGLGLPLAYRYRDGDVLLEAWSDDTRTPADREGLA